MDFQQNNQPEVQNNQPNNQQAEQPNSSPALGAQPSGNSSYNNVNNNLNNNMNNNPYNHNPYQNQNNGQNPNVNNGYGYPNNNGYNNNYNNGYNNGYNNNNPYYNRNVYQMPQTEPGNGLFTAAFVLGIVALVFCFTFTVYPAYIFGSIAIVLALLSKGKNAKMHSKASVGIICAIAALVLNTCIVTYSMTTIFTNPEVYEEFNDTCEEIYGMSFDEMIEEIMEESGSSY